jgi:hypothetical protein
MLAIDEIRFIGRISRCYLAGYPAGYYAGYRGKVTDFRDNPAAGALRPAVELTAADGDPGGISAIATRRG